MPAAVAPLEVDPPHPDSRQQQQHHLHQHHHQQELHRPYSAGATADHAADSPAGQRSSLGGAAAAEAAAVPEIDASAVTLGKRLGAGAYATVYVAQLEGAKKPVVVKRLDRVGPAEEQQVTNEVEMYRSAGLHPNLVALRSWYRDEHGVLCLVMGYCEGGTLTAVLKSHAGGAEEGLFAEDTVMGWFVQLLLALNHLHSRKILHRDVKPENIFLSKNLRVVKLGDLGISKQLQEGISLAVTCTGTPAYMSPETVTSRPYTYASDVWALGCCLYEMAARKPAFSARGLPQLVMKILRNAYQPLPPGSFSRAFNQLLGAMLRADPDDRPTTSDLMGLSLVKKHLERLMAQSGRSSTSVSASGTSFSSTTGRPSGLRRPLASGDGISRSGSSNMAAAVSALGAISDAADLASPASSAGPKSPETGNTGRRPGSGGAAGAGLNGKAVAGAAAAGSRRPRTASGVAAASDVPVVQARARAAKAWDTAHEYESSQKKAAEMRAQHRIIEQRMAREQARQRRKELDPSAGAKAAELDRVRAELLQAKRDAQQAVRQQARMQREQQTEQEWEAWQGAGDGLAAGGGWPAAGDDADDGGIPEQQERQEEEEDEGVVEEEEGLLLGVDVDEECEDEDLPVWLSAVKGSQTRLQSHSTSRSSGSSPDPNARLPATAGAAVAPSQDDWRSLVSSLEEDELVHYLPRGLASMAAAAGAPEPAPAAAAASGAASSTTAARFAAPGRMTDSDPPSPPEPEQCCESPTVSGNGSRLGRRSGHQQALEQLEGELESQLESQLSKVWEGAAGSVAATQQLLDSIYSMSLNAQGAGKGKGEKHQQQSQQQQRKLDALAASLPAIAPQPVADAGAAAAAAAATAAATAAQEKQQRQQQADVIDKAAGVAFSSIVNSMMGGIFGGGGRTSDASTKAAAQKLPAKHANRQPSMSPVEQLRSASFTAGVDNAASKVSLHSPKRGATLSELDAHGLARRTASASEHLGARPLQQQQQQQSQLQAALGSKPRVLSAGAKSPAQHSSSASPRAQGQQQQSNTSPLSQQQGIAMQQNGTTSPRAQLSRAGAQQQQQPAGLQTAAHSRAQLLGQQGGVLPKSPASSSSPKLRLPSVSTSAGSGKPGAS